MNDIPKELQNKKTTMRLQSYLSLSGVCSRRNAIEKIRSGKVTVNKTVVTAEGYRVETTHDIVRYNGKICSLKTLYVYFLLNKPTEVESTNANTTIGKKASIEYIRPYYKEHIFYAGRLDFMSSGLMVYTNDGELVYMLTHPKYAIKKRYTVKSTKKITGVMLAEWKKGIIIDKIRYTLDSYSRITSSVKKISYKKHPYLHKVHICLTEGKNREIRNVFAHFKIPIQSLHRTALWKFELGNIPVGGVQALKADCVKKLKENTI